MASYYLICHSWNTGKRWISNGKEWKVFWSNWANINHVIRVNRFVCDDQNSTDTIYKWYTNFSFHFHISTRNFHHFISFLNGNFFEYLIFSIRNSGMFPLSISFLHSHVHPKTVIALKKLNILNSYSYSYFVFFVVVLKFNAVHFLYPTSSLSLKHICFVMGELHIISSSFC